MSKEPTKGTTTAKVVISKPEDLITHCRMSAARGQKTIVATKEVIQSFTTPDYNKHHVDVMGIKIVEDGFEDEVAKEFSLTTEELLFG